MPEWKEEIRRRLAGLNLEPTRESEIVEELSQHLEDRYQELMADGRAPEQAARAVLEELNDSELLKQELRRVERQITEEPIVLGTNRRRSVIADLWHDLRYGLRMMGKQPAFTAVAVITLALGIGANAAIFSVVNAVLLRPLPYHNADELVLFYHMNSQGDAEMLVPATYLPIKNQNSVFADVATWDNSTWPANLTGDGDPERLQGFKVSANLFQVLGVAAAQGRTFLPEEDRPGNNHVVVISHDLWQRRFGGDSEMIGRSIFLNGAAYQVVGVMPADFRFILKTDVWTTLALTAAEEADRGSIYLHPLARLKPGVSTRQARAEVENLLRPHVNNPDSDALAMMQPLKTVLMGEANEMMFILFAAVGFVLLIACANVANLLLARASVRRRELAIRAALGAGRLRIIRQLLAESAMLAAFGGACGLLLANWCIRVLVSGLPEWIAAKNSHVATLKLDGWALGYAFALSLLTTVIFGLVPAIQASKVNLNEALKEGGRGDARGRGQNRLRSLLVVTEVALAVVLLVGAGLMIKSFWRLSNTPRGFDPAGVLTAKVDPSGDRYREPNQVVEFYRQLLERVSAIPGVQHAGITNGFLDRGCLLVIEEHPPVPEEERPGASRYPVSADYFRAMGIPLRAGRFFTDRDVAGAPPVVIIDETVQRRHFPDENPIGKHLRFNDALREIVGVVGATRAWKGFSFNGDEESPRVYLPYPQEKPWATMALMVRAQAGDPTSLIPAIRRELAAIDKDQPIYSFKLLEQSVAELNVDRRFSTWLLTAFAALAAALAAVGIYGVMSYTVAQRAHEIGIRMALGAQARDVVALVIRQGMGLALIGVVIGLVGALALTRVMASWLFGVSASDPTTFAVISLLLVAVTLIACYVPARRATKVDPIIALRCE
ncbi:MAG TPA: ABC transporter permease [Blastocatellia bacterium]|nr:ABC transporter permease [Blastocatellia bacterium]